jgi:hypothetical protein
MLAGTPACSRSRRFSAASSRFTERAIVKTQPSRPSRTHQAKKQIISKAPISILPEPQISSLAHQTRELAARWRVAAPLCEQNRPRGASITNLGSWAALFAIFAMSFSNRPSAPFGLLIIKARSAKIPTSALGLADVLRTEVATASGALAGSEALAQFVTVPA